MIEELGSPFFRDAARDFLFLLDRGYPERSILKIVGDRYALSRDQRQVLFRGITSSSRAAGRIVRIMPDARGQEIYIDGYNVLLTIMNYLAGRVVFIANDGLLRDVGESYGSIKHKDVFARSLELMLWYLGDAGTISITVYLDSPVSHSARHRQTLAERMAELNLSGEVILVKSADYRLKSQSRGLVATSDSVILDTTPSPVFDLARKVLEAKFEATFFEIGNLLA